MIDLLIHFIHCFVQIEMINKRCVCVFFPFAINVYWVIEGDTPHWEFFPNSHFAPWDHIESSVFSFDRFFIWSRVILFATNAFPYFSTLEISFAIMPNRSNHQIISFFVFAFNFCFCLFYKRLHKQQKYNLFCPLNVLWMLFFFVILRHSNSISLASNCRYFNYDLNGILASTFLSFTSQHSKFRTAIK